MNFETVIGLEVHVELNTNSKIFSPTSAHFGNDQNANTNVIDWSFPGVLPVLNKGVVDAGIKAALALNMDIHKKMHFDRKNYFYPDNPKAYQISQFDEPIGYNGWIEVELEDGTTKKIGIERAHLEEDAGKNTMVQMVTLMLTSTAKGCLWLRLYLKQTCVHQKKLMLI